MTSLPQVREHINAADFQTVAAFLPPAGDGRTLAVSANEKAVILRGGRVVDMFSGGSKPVQKDDEVVVASLRKYQLIIGFGDCSHSHYNFSPTRIHASRPAFRVADGEEIRSMIVAVSFALDRDDRANVEKLMAVNMASADAITVADLAASLPELPQFIQTLIAVQRFDGPSIRTADPDRIAGIERQILLAADGMLREYGVLSDSAVLNVIATSRDAELTMPEKEREANAEHLLKLANLHREDGRLERQIQAMEKRLETERIAHQTEKMRTEIMQERLKQSRIQAEIELIDPRIGETSTNDKPLSPPRTTAAPPAQTVGNSPPASGESRYWLNETAAGVTLHRGTCAHVKNWAKPPNWRGFSTREIALNSTRRPVLGCSRCSPYLGSDANVPTFTREELAKVNRKDSKGRTRLHQAVSMGNTETARKLIDSGADITIKDKEGKTPLHFAVIGDRIEMAQALIDAGANLESGDKDSNTPLHEAAYRGRTEVAQALIDAGANVNAESDNGYTPLHRASYTKGRTETARLLIAAGADINAKDDYGGTPLHVCEDAETARALIDAGADIHAKDKDDRTPLHEASSFELSTFRAMADNGVSVSFTGPLPLGGDSSFGLATAQALIAAGARVDAKDKDGRTPLHQAVDRNSLGVVQTLIAAGADANAADNDGKTPLDMALDEGTGSLIAKDEGTKNLILQEVRSAARAKKSGYTQLRAAVIAGDTKTAQALIATGLDIDAKDASGDTPLHRAAGGARGTETTQALIAAGANLAAKDKYGNTPLHRAAYMGRTETAQVLITAGANLNAVNASGDTPLHRAAYGGRTETARALIAAGANLNARDSNGNTPLRHATYMGKRETAQALIAADADNNGGIPPDMADIQGQPETAQPIADPGGQPAKTSWLGKLFGR